MIKKLVKKLGKKKSGFTLIELIVVIAILGILAAILVPTVGNFIGSAKDGAAQADAHSVFTAATTVVAQNSTTAFTGYKAGSTTLITDTQLASYLGAKTTWKFTIDDITFDATTGGVTSVQILENGKHYKYTGAAFTSSATAMTQP
jgi:type IV pilus assembly protein PilA